MSREIALVVEQFIGPGATSGASLGVCDGLWHQKRNGSIQKKLTKDKGLAVHFRSVNQRMVLFLYLTYLSDFLKAAFTVKAEPAVPLLISWWRQSGIAAATKREEAPGAAAVR